MILGNKLSYFSNTKNIFFGNRGSIFQNLLNKKNYLGLFLKKHHYFQIY